MKLFAAFAFVLICLAAWSIHGVPGITPAPPKAAAPAAPSALRMNPEMYADALRRNAPLRTKLAKQYPESYARLEQQTKRDLNGCLVSQVVEGMLKAVCQ